MDSAPLELSRPRARTTVVPYLVIALAWFAFFLVASRVRMIEPVFLWVLTQGLLLEKVALSGYWTPAVFLLAAYLLFGLIAWWLVERSKPREPNHVWRRAFFSWIVIQLLYGLTATLARPGRDSLRMKPLTLHCRLAVAICVLGLAPPQLFGETPRLVSEMKALGLRFALLVESQAIDDRPCGLRMAVSWRSIWMRNGRL